MFWCDCCPAIRIEGCVSCSSGSVFRLPYSGGLWASFQALWPPSSPSTPAVVVVVAAAAVVVAVVVVVVVVVVAAVDGRVSAADPHRWKASLSWIEPAG